MKRHETKNNRYAQLLTERVKAAGQEVIDRASDLVGDGELMSHFEIILHFEQDYAPEIEVVKKFINKKVIERIQEEK